MPTSTSLTTTIAASPRSSVNSSRWLLVSPHVDGVVEAEVASKVSAPVPMRTARKGAHYVGRRWSAAGWPTRALAVLGP